MHAVWLQLLLYLRCRVFLILRVATAAQINLLVASSESHTRHT